VCPTRTHLSKGLPHEIAVKTGDVHPLMILVHCYSAKLDQVGEELGLRGGMASEGRRSR